MKNLFFFLFVICCLYACHPNRVFEEHKDLSPNVEWKQDKTIEFSVDIADSDQVYNVYLCLRHITGFPYKTMVVNLTTTDPSGVTQSKKYKIKVAEDGVGYLGEGAGDYWDVTDLIEESTELLPGRYTFTAEHAMPEDPVPFVMELGMIVEKVVEEK